MIELYEAVSVFFYSCSGYIVVITIKEFLSDWRVKERKGNEVN